MRFTTVLFLISISNLGLFSQKVIDPIQVIRLGGKAVSIDFVDPTNNYLIKSIDLDSLNPYEGFLFEKVKHPDLIRPSYIIPDSARSQLGYWKMDSPVIDKSIEDRYPVYFSSWVSISGSRHIQYYIAVGCFLYSYNKEHRLLNIHATYFVFNFRGEITTEIYHILESRFPRILAITDDGGFLGVTGLEFNNSELQSFEIFNTKTNDVVHRELYHNVDNQIFPTSIDRNRLLVSGISDFKERRFQVYSPEEGLVLERVFDWNETKLITRYDHKGIYMALPNNDETYIAYDDFPVLKLISK